MIRFRLIPLLMVPLTGLEAQGGKVIARTPAPPSKQPMVGACAAIANIPSPLVSTPEGLALLRFKKELEGAATVFVQRDSAMRAERRMVELQRGRVDSLMRVFVSTRSGDSAQTSTYTFKKGDSTLVLTGKMLDDRPRVIAMEGAVRAIRPDVEVTLRSIEPRMAAMTNARMITAASTTGYMGINLSGSQIRMVTDSGIYTAHCDYPMIEAVDVGSPARKADLRAGDTIVAYNNRDIVAQSINYPQLLVPGKVVKVKVRRDGKARDVDVTVIKRPQEFADNSVRWTPIPGGGMIAPAPMMGGAPRVAPGYVTTTVGPSATAQMAPSPRLVASNASMLTIFGAQLNTMDEAFAQRLNTKPGFLVLRVMDGSPAAEAGLHAGETILAVNGTPAKELMVLQKVMSSGARDVQLTVNANDSPPRIVTIRW